MADQWSTMTTDWQGVDEVPIAGSQNLVKSGEVADTINNMLSEITSGVALSPSDFLLENGYINQSGIEVSSNNYRRTMYIAVKIGQIVNIKGQYTSSSPLAIAGYSSKDVSSFVSGIQMSSSLINFDYEVPATVKYVRLVFTASNLSTYSITISSADNLETRLKAYVDDELSLKMENSNVVLEDGLIDANGQIANSIAYKHTVMLPIIDGYGYYVNIAPYRCNAYNSPKFESASHLGIKNFNAVISDNTKYIAFTFDANTDLSGLQIISLKDVKCMFENLFIEPRKWYCLLFNGYTLQDLYKFMSGCVNDMCFSGSSVSPSTDYIFQLRAFNTANNIRMIVYDGSTKVNDSTFINTGDGIFEGSNGNVDYKLSVKLDYNAVASTQILMSPTEAFLLKKEVLNRHRIRKVPVSSEIVDYSDYFTTNKGAVAGYVRYDNGNFSAGGDTFIVTDYIPTENLLFVKATVPTGTSAGLAFYNKNKTALTDYQGTGAAGYRDATDGSSNVDVFKEIPADASYFRVTGSASDENKKIYVVRKIEIPEYESISKNAIQLTPRATKVIWDYRNFDGMNGKSRVTLSQNTLSEDVRQIRSKYYQFVNDEKFEVSFVAGPNCFIGIGIEFYIMSEVRVQGNQFTIKCGSSPFDTYSGISPVVVFTQTLPFTVTSGKTYKLGIIKRDAYKIGDTFYSDATFFIDDFEGHYYEKTIPRNAPASEYNDVSGRYIAACLGKPFVSLKQGAAVITNVSLSSDYSPRAKVMITGDSFVDGDTMALDGEEHKYASLLQQAIGQDSFVINGRGGGGLEEEWLIYFTQLIKVFCPQYVIIALGTNNRTYSTYLSVMQLTLNMLDTLGITPVLVTVTPVKVGTDTDARAAFRQSANSWVRNSGRMYVDINKAVTTDADGAVWNPDYVRADGIHPTVAGHQAIFEAFKREVPELFNV